MPVPGAGVESSDSSDDFAGADSVDDETDEELGATAKGKRRKISHVQSKTPTEPPTPTKQSAKSKKIDRSPQQTPKKSTPRARPTTPRTPVGKSKASPKASSAAKSKTSSESKASKGKSRPQSNGPAAGHEQTNLQLPTPSKSCKKAKAQNGGSSQSSPVRGKGAKAKA